MDDPSPVAVGFVGLGMMGQALVSRLLAASIPVVVANRSPGPVREAVAAGAAAAVNPREVGRRTASGIVFVMVSDGRAQRSVLFGRSGVAAGLAAGGLVVDLSTVAPADSRSAAAR
ncbi:MAG TPA: NAD(P)-binding domain-containing protein, partial [Thermoplasmata archaeon]|nr:NAD(P)-binding domain-containing protein [Thermoplasmata archaeon]